MSKWRPERCKRPTTHKEVWGDATPSWVSGVNPKGFYLISRWLIDVFVQKPLRFWIFMDILRIFQWYFGVFLSPRLLMKYGPSGRWAKLHLWWRRVTDHWTEPGKGLQQLVKLTTTSPWGLKMVLFHVVFLNFNRENTMNYGILMDFGGSRFFFDPH